MKFLLINKALINHIISSFCEKNEKYDKYEKNKKIEYGLLLLFCCFMNLIFISFEYLDPPPLSLDTICKVDSF
jgi:hypothetical protein